MYKYRFFGLMIVFATCMAGISVAQPLTSKAGRPASIGQPAKIPKPLDSVLQIQERVFNNARSVNDYGTAVQALHYLLAADARYAKYTDTLASLYMAAGNYASAFALSSILLQKDSLNNFALGIRSAAADQAQQPLIALEGYKLLYKRTSSMQYGYRSLQLHCAAGRYGDATALATQLVTALPVMDSSKVGFAMPDNRSTQQVGLKAGIYFMQGLAYGGLKDTSHAEMALRNALELSPDFELAKSELEKITKN